MQNSPTGFLVRRRRSQRFEVSDIAVEVTTPNRNRIEALLFDQSIGGIGIWIHDLGGIAMHQQIEYKALSSEGSGVVVSISEFENGFRVGIDCLGS